MNNEELIHLAIEARKNAMTPTNYYVGAALLTDTGKIYTGCNIGTEDGLFDYCAEHIAVVKMLSEGEREIKKIAIVGGPGENMILTTPCGICRQFLLEFGSNAEVICAYYQNGELQQKSYFVKDLLPYGYVM